MDSFHVFGVYKSYKQNRVLKNVDLYVKPGDVIGLIGNNGAGKTTFLEILAGFLSWDKGEIRVNQQLSNPQQLSKYAAYINDDPNLPQHLNVHEFLSILVKSTKARQKPEQVESVDHMINLIGLKHKSTISQLSKGQKQRLALISLLISSKKVILLDEPTTALDFEGSIVFSSIINRLKKAGKMIIVSSHDLLSIERICNKILIVESGMFKEITKTQDSDTCIFISFKNDIKSHLMNLPSSIKVTPRHQNIYQFEWQPNNVAGIETIFSWIVKHNLAFHSIKHIDLNAFYNQEEPLERFYSAS